jgi:acyl-coenzyme A thioesterase PaaI-like protein
MLDSVTALGLYGVLPPEQTAVTVNLNVTYVRPGKLGTFTARSRLLKRDARFAEVAAELIDADGVMVASAIAKLRIIRRVHLRQLDAEEGA